MEIIIALELVQKLATRNGKVPAAEAFECGARFPLECTSDQGFRGGMVLIGELDVRDIAFRGGRIDEHRSVTTHEAPPFKIGRNVLSGVHHLRIQRFLAVRLPANVLIERSHGLLNSPDDMCLELLERVLYR